MKTNREKALQKMTDEQGKHREMHKARTKLKYAHTHNGVKSKEAKVERGNQMKKFYNNLMK